ncbi:MAG: hypothetical protein EAZ79_03350 [Oscillatoriales cyanobacterium]|nr:MAG: hypothetical protein EAZ79_03350 [Oscillatoriales cyanobacterium]
MLAILALAAYRSNFPSKLDYVKTVESLHNACNISTARLLTGVLTGGAAFGERRTEGYRILAGAILD